MCPAGHRMTGWARELWGEGAPLGGTAGGDTGVVPCPCARFATKERDGLLLYNGRFNEKHDFVALEIVGEQVQLTFSAGTRLAPCPRVPRAPCPCVPSGTTSRHCIPGCASPALHPWHVSWVPHPGTASHVLHPWHCPRHCSPGTPIPPIPPVSPPWAARALVPAGETTTTVSPFVPGGVSDGQWHRVQLHYYNKVGAPGGWEMGGRRGGG